MATQSATIARSHKATHANNAYLGRRFGKGTVYVILTVVTIFWIIPMLWAVDTAFKPETETTTIPVSWFPTHFTLQAFQEVLQAGDLPRWYLNSILTSVIITVLTVLLSSMAAFAFSRIPFRGRNAAFWLILAGIMVPAPLLLIPLLTVIQSFGMVNSYWGLILPQIAVPVAVFIFKQFFDGLPHDLEDAAIMDGASRCRVYCQIWMPLSQPAIAAVALFALLASLDNLVWPFISRTNTAMITPAGGPAAGPASSR